MSGNVLAWYLKECLLEAKQIPIHVNDSPKKLATKDKTKPLGFQRVGLKSEQLKVTGLGYLIVPFRMKKLWSQHVLLHLKE
jgi:hypothetical protein